MIVTGISGTAGCVLFGADLGRLGAVTERLEDGRGLSPRLARRSGQAGSVLRVGQGPQGRRLPAPVARGLVTSQRLPKALQCVRVLSQQQIAAPQVVQGVSHTVGIADFGE